MELRKEFRLYLEKSGAIDALSKAFVKLYEEPNKPENAVQYIRKYMCSECPIEEEYEALKADHNETLKKLAELEEKINRFIGNQKLTHDEMIEALDKGLQELLADKSSESLLKRYLNKDILKELKSLKTKYNGIILDCVQSGFENHNSKIGLYAADSECYSLFSKLFDPIISLYYGVKISEQVLKPSYWGDPLNIAKNLDIGDNIVSTRITVSRNLNGFPFVRLMTEDQFKEVEDKIKSTLLSIEGVHAGSFMKIKEIDPDKYSQLIHKKIAFEKNDVNLENAGCYRFWPTGRGIFYTCDEHIYVWINAEDHIKVISTEKTGDLTDVYHRLFSFMTILNKNLEFASNKRYGYLTFSIENLGTGLNASIRVKLPKLLEEREKLDKLLSELNFIMHERSGIKKFEENIVEISAKRKLELTEFEFIKSFEEGILELLKAEDSLNSY